MKRSALPLRASSRSLPPSDRGYRQSIIAHLDAGARHAPGLCADGNITSISDCLPPQRPRLGLRRNRLSSAGPGAQHTTQGPHHPGAHRRCPGAQAHSPYTRSDVSHGDRTALRLPAAAQQGGDSREGASRWQAAAEVCPCWRGERAGLQIGTHTGFRCSLWDDPECA